MQKQEVMSAYREMKQRAKEVQKIDRIIEEREAEGFRLPEDFDPSLSSE